MLWWVDKGLHMLSIVKKKYQLNSKIKFFNSNVQNLNFFFDIISALFHILGYQIKLQDIKNFFFNSRKYLKKNDLLKLDFRFKDGVINLRLPLKCLKVSNSKYSVYRITRSRWLKKKQQIHNIHEMIEVDKKSKKERIFKEIYKMRYFQLSVIKKYLRLFNFKYFLSTDLLTNKFPGNNSRGTLIIERKI